jgi:hypothetical protein
MKKIIITSITFLIFISAFAQNGLKLGNLFLLQKDKKAISVNSFENEKLNELKTFPISEKSIYTTDQKARVAVLDTAKNIISLFDISTENKSELKIPFDLKPKTILLNAENLFIGGEMGKEMLVQYNFQSKEWYKLQIPIEVMFPGKAIDDLIVNDSLLIAIDNIVMPKYVLFYKLNSMGKLDYSHFKELKSNSSYESIHLARITTNYLGLYSTTMNWGTVREHITIYSDLELLKSFAITTVYKNKGSFNDFLILGDRLYIANSFNGLGVLYIKNSYFTKSKYEHDIFNAEIEESLVNYEKIKNGEIIKLTKIPNEQKIILTIKNTNGKIRNEVRYIE